MSGNSPRLGVSAAEADWPKALQALGLIALFVAGAAAGSVIVLGRGRQRQALLLLVEALLLGGGALGYGFGSSQSAIAAIVLAMGLENAVCQIHGGAGLGLTYVTSALVKAGQQIAAALTGGPRPGWLAHPFVVAALVAGALFGARAFSLGQLPPVRFS